MKRSVQLLSLSTAVPPQWMIAGLDREAARLGVTRQAVIKTWIAEKLK